MLETRMDILSTCRECTVSCPCEKDPLPDPGLCSYMFTEKMDSSSCLMPAIHLQQQGNQEEV